MKIEDIKAGDVLANVDGNGCAYYLVTKVNRVTIDALSENGNKVRCYPSIFNRKITYPVAAFTAHSIPGKSPAQGTCLSGIGRRSIEPLQRAQANELGFLMSAHSTRDGGQS